MPLPSADHPSPRPPRGPSRRVVLRAGAAGSAAAAAGSVLAGCGGQSGGAGGGPVTIEMWHGQTDTGRAAIEALVAEFHRTPPGIRVDTGGGVLSDAMLQ